MLGPSTTRGIVIVSEACLANQSHAFSTAAPSVVLAGAASAVCRYALVTAERRPRPLEGLDAERTVLMSFALVRSACRSGEVADAVCVTVG